MGKFQQKFLDEASTLDPTQLQMFTHGLCDHDRGTSALHCCKAKQQDELAEDSFFKGGPTPCIHDAFIELPLHRELVYQELQTDLEKAIQDNSSAIFKKIKQGAPTDGFSNTIPTAQGTIQSAAGSASDVLREEYPSGISFGVTNRTPEDDSGVVSGIAIPSHTSGDHETEDSDVVIVSTTPATEYQALTKIPYHDGPGVPEQQRLHPGIFLKSHSVSKLRLLAPSR